MTTIDTNQIAIVKKENYLSSLKSQLSTLNSKLSISKGFTLIELMVVIAILAVLATVVLLAINPAAQVAKAGDAKVKSDMGQIVNALQAEVVDNGAYPLNITAGGAITGSNSVTYLQDLPSGFTYNAVGSLTNAVIYETLSSNTTHVWCWDNIHSYTMVTIGSALSSAFSASALCQ